LLPRFGVADQFIDACLLGFLALGQVLAPFANFRLLVPTNLFLYFAPLAILFLPVQR